MAIGLNLSADPIRTATPSPAAANPAATTPQEVSREREPSQLEKAAEREQAAPEEREIVSVSEDGDTVAVRRENAQELAEQGSVTETQREDDTDAAAAAVAEDEQERAAEEITAPEIVPIEAPEIEPIELPEAAQEAIEEIEAAAEAEAVETEAPERQITSFAGYTNDQIEQMYLDGEISQYDYNQEIESREQRLENIQVSNEELSDRMNVLDAADRDVTNQGNAIAAATSDNASQTLTAQQRLDAIDTLTDRDAAEKRNTEDIKVQWDYQSNA